MFHNLTMNRGNRKLLEVILQEVASTQSPFKLRFTYAFRNRKVPSSGLVTVNYSLESQTYDSLYEDMRDRLLKSDALVVSSFEYGGLSELVTMKDS